MEPELVIIRAALIILVLSWIWQDRRIEKIKAELVALRSANELTALRQKMDEARKELAALCEMLAKGREALGE